MNNKIHMLESKKWIFPIIFLSLILFLSQISYSQRLNQDVIDSYFKNLPFKMDKIELPKFPEKYFKITDFGAVGNGVFKNTESIQKAINECSKAGGGSVIVPAGLWLTGPIEMKNDVNLHLEKGALVVFSANHDDYPMIKHPDKSNYVCAFPILGVNLNNIAITGEGIFDGNGQTWRPVKKSKQTDSEWKRLLNSGGALNKSKDMWWPSLEAQQAEEFLSTRSPKEMKKEDFEKIKDFYRPHMLYLKNCKNILIDGPTFANSPNFTICPTFCENMIIYNAKVNNEWYAQNADGIDISGCKNVLVAECTVNAGDDGICMKCSKQGKNKTEATLQNIVIENCVVYHGHGGFVIGSNTDGGAKNISVNNCNFINTDVGLRFKSGRGRGGIVENIFIKNIYMKNIENEAILFDLFYEDKGAVKTKDTKVEDKMPFFKNIYMNNIFCDGAKQAFLINSNPERAVSNIELIDVVLVADKGFEASEAEKIKLNNVIIKSKRSPIINIKNSNNLLFNNISCSGSPDLFMKISGEKTSQIILESTKTDCAKKALEIGTEVKKDALIIK